MRDVFIGRQAVATGRLTRHELQRWYRPIYRGVYAPKRHEPSLRDRTVGALLTCRRGLLLIDAGFRRPVTQIPVVDGWRLVRVLDMGWEDLKVAAEYDGDLGVRPQSEVPHPLAGAMGPIAKST